MNPNRPVRCRRLAASILVASGLLLMAAGCVDEADPIGVTSRRDQWLHVATDGSSFNDGSPDAPHLDPALAIARAWEYGYRGVRIAVGEYSGLYSSVGLRFAGGVDVVGGCDATTWEPVPGATSTLHVHGRAARATGITIATAISGLTIVSVEPGASPRGSAPALLIEGCGPGLVFTSCHFRAGNGADWADPAQDGYAYETGAGAESGQDGSCGGDIAAGGFAGLDGVCGSDGGSGGAPGSPGQGTWSACDNPGSGVAGGAPDQNGMDGVDGADGADGQPGAPAPLFGVLGADGFRRQEGDRGGAGQSGGGGSGGGGGGGAAVGTGSGGGGGGGGVGGRGSDGGHGGRGGGHSIAAITSQSDCRFRDCRFEAGDGGRGQDAGRGQPGPPGAAGSPGGIGCGGAGDGGRGGDGGPGGDGSGGVGGNGGHSIGLLAIGTLLPDTDAACVIVAGTAGQPGQGGLGGDGVTRAPDGVAGVAAGLHILQTAADSRSRRDSQ
jgi:hypothetical protein